MPLSDCAARKRAQRRRPKNQACEWCGTTAGRIDAHHQDIENKPEEVTYLCTACHAKADQQDKKRWRNPLKHTLNKKCAECGKLVTEQRERTTFCSRACSLRHKATKAANADGETRTTCLVCGLDIPGRIRKGRRFCSRSCATVFRNSR